MKLFTGQSLFEVGVSRASVPLLTSSSVVRSLLPSFTTVSSANGILSIIHHLFGFAFGFEYEIFVLYCFLFGVIMTFVRNIKCKHLWNFFLRFGQVCC